MVGLAMVDSGLYREASAQGYIMQVQCPSRLRFVWHRELLVGHASYQPRECLSGTYRTCFTMALRTHGIAPSYVPIPNSLEF